MSIHAPYPTRSGHRDLEGPFFIYFETNGSSDADGVVDDAAVVNGTIAYSATGSYAIALNDTFTNVYAQAWWQEAAGGDAMVSATTGSSITVQTTDGAGSTAETNNKTIGVVFWGQR